jgi:hypothetical protein
MVRVRRRTSSRRSRSTSAATSRSLPMSGVSGVGKFVEWVDEDVSDTDGPLDR